MKQIIGIDRDGHYREAVRLLSRLDFANSTTLLAHVLEPIWIPVPVLPSPQAPVTLSPRYIDESFAGRLMEEAKAVASASHLGDDCLTVITDGNPSVSLISLADGESADLIAVGSRRRGTAGSFLLGSTGRALAIEAKQSFLIGRPDGPAEGSIRAIFATDHSDYADRCFEELLRMNPRGLKDLTVVTASAYNPLDDELGLDLADRYNLDLGERTTVGRLRELMQSHGEEMVGRIKQTGRTGRYSVVEDYPIEGIRETMLHTKADLLIMGARGHGFVERLLIGSLSLHMVVAEQFSVLVMRVPDEAPE